MDEKLRKPSDLRFRGVAARIGKVNDGFIEKRKSAVASLARAAGYEEPEYEADLIIEEAALCETDSAELTETKLRGVIEERLEHAKEA